MYASGKKTFRTMQAAVLDAKEKGEWVGDVPTKNQFANKIRQYKEEELSGNYLISANPNSFAEYVNQNSAVPENWNKMFVCGYQFVRKPTKCEFRMCFSTWRLLHFGPVEWQVLHADDTDNCVWLSFPVLTLGVTDKHKVFHPIIGA
mgnify:CR=1 FL=1